MDGHTLAPAEIEPHPMRFTGSGGEYFRIWIVNILLSVLTLGLYTPWARRRTVQYFYSNTEVAGSTLEFTAPIRRMVFGFLMFVLLYFAFELASRTGQDTATALLMTAGALLAPFLWASAVRFRLAHTRWRGLRLHFKAGWGEAYLASWPLLLIVAGWVGVIALVGGGQDTAPNTPPTFEAVDGIAVLAAALLTLLCHTALRFNYTRLTMLRTWVGQQAGRWKLRFRDYLRIVLLSIGILVLTGFVLGFVAGFAGGGALFLFRHRGSGAVFLVIGLLLLSWTLVFVPAVAFSEARTFRLIWNQAGLGQIARSRCELSTRGFIWLSIRNALLTVLTLGFYRPFARVNAYRMKCESVTLHVRGGVDALVGDLSRQQQDGFGDAIADAVGLDIVG